MPGSSGQLDKEKNRRNKGNKGRGNGPKEPIPKTEEDSRIKPERLIQNY